MTDKEGVEPRLRPKKANLEREIRALGRGVRPGDRLVFYFAGHSDQIPCRTGSEEDNMDEALVALSGAKIRDNALYNWLVRDLPKGSSLTAVFDCCNSGTMLDLKHYKCNNVYHPWVNKGRRGSGTLRNVMTRRNCRVRSGALSRPQSRKSSTENIQHNIMQTLESPSLSPVDEGSDKSSVDEGSNKHQGQRCMSPERQFCEGWCRDSTKRKGSLQHADVVSISSSNDGQISWDASTRNGDSISMTSSLIKILKKHDRITYSDLMTLLNHEVHKFTLQMHKHVRKDRRSRRGIQRNASRRNTDPNEDKGEMDNFQDLQLGSISPLDMNRLFQL